MISLFYDNKTFSLILFILTDFHINNSLTQLYYIQSQRRSFYRITILEKYIEGNIVKSQLVPRVSWQICKPMIFICSVFQSYVFLLYVLNKKKKFRFSFDKMFFCQESLRFSSKDLNSYLYTEFTTTLHMSNFQ